MQKSPCCSIFITNAKITRGFTFIELILSLSILSIVAVTLYGSFNIGIKAWQRGEESNELYQEARIVFKKMGRDLMSAIIPIKKEIKDGSTESKIKFVGEPGKVIFLAKAKKGISQIAYQISFLEEKKVLEREEKNDNGKQEKVVLAEIEDLGFRYYDSQEKEWSNQWSNPAELPAGVEITIHIGRNEKIVFEQIVALPVGRKFSRSVESSG